ncbi:iron-sulfur cluster assembly accessory protein [Actinomyces sp. F1_1611]
MTQISTQHFDLRLTEAALALLQPRAERIALRLAVVPGGCSGFRYVVTLVPKTGPEPDALAINCDGVTVLVDPDGAELLAGITVGHDSTGFTVDNPNARGACACGASFAPHKTKGN